jgi:hypothetical protein
MANNIQIVGTILNSTLINRYSNNDLRLLSSTELQENFGDVNDYIEYYIYDISGNLLNISYDYKDFKLPSNIGITPPSNQSTSNTTNSIPSTDIGIVSNTNSQTGSLYPIIEIDPVKDLQNNGYSSGEFTVRYNFFQNKISSPSAELFIKEISSNRTEISVVSTILTNSELEEKFNTLFNEIDQSNYFVDYLINFGENQQVLAVNIALNRLDSGYEILFKLYEPLPDNITTKTSLWVVDEKVDPYVFNINLDTLITEAPGPKLRGPNFSIPIQQQGTISTSYQTYDSLLNNLQSIQSSSYGKILNLLTTQSIDINVDYTNFSEFSFFGSVNERLGNFYTKVKQIEDYKNAITTYSSSSLSSSLANSVTASINNIIANFDGYEYYLYFESSSYTWPKTNSTLPYILATTASATTWYNSFTGSAESYDDSNPNYIINTLPSFVKDDENNAQYITFLNMIGHYFDNIWIYLQSVTDINLANNNLEQGVSKDLVYHVLQSLGTKLYNQYGDSDNTNFLIGTSGSAYYTGSDAQAFTYTGSYLNTIPRKDLLAESYKRIYHNLPLLMKTKGTTYGLQTLISTFGITGSILGIKEYGGELKSSSLSEFSNDKIRVVSNTIVSGSVLSPYISLQQQPTASTTFRTNDLHYVDVSFSPQSYIDTFVSKSITSVSSSWALDDYIGDPRQQYSSSYSDLTVQKNKYYSPLTASIIPFIGSAGSGSIGATDYNSFIRLIQFFDNSLFKMIKDFIPARVNLSTGITINSPVLERNKWTMANPSATSKISSSDGTIEGPTIGTEYNNLYTYLTGSKVGYYDGNITGSGVNVYNYFASGNFNPYLFPTSSIDTNIFNHSEFNITLNNVSQSRVSLIRKDIEYIFGTTGSITSSAELQDSYESLRTHQLSRYDGVKIYSLLYNTYTSASSDYGGDLSYGKTAVIDRNSIKVGLFSEVTANKFLPKRNNTVLKYLVDADGNFTELNLRNSHWQEIQNTFVANHTGSISLFNNQLYSNQKATEGEKSVFDSGYSYNPILYFAGTGSDSKIYFQTLGQTSANTAIAKNTLIDYHISGSGPGLDQYPLSGGYVYNIFDSLVNAEASTYFKPGTISQFPTYSATSTGDYSVAVSLPVSIEVPSSIDAVWSLQVWVSGSTRNELIENGSDVYNFNSTPPASSYRIFSLIFSVSNNCPSDPPDHTQNAWVSADDYDRIQANEGGTGGGPGVLKSGIVLYNDSGLSNRIYGYSYVKYNGQINDMFKYTGTVSVYTTPQC